MPPGLPPKVEPEPMEYEYVDTRPRCWLCGEPMEETGEREIDLEGGFFVVYEPIYECFNPDCYDDDESDRSAGDDCLH